MNIGSIKSTGKGYEGILNTLIIHRPITVEPNRNGGEKAPHFRVFDGTREIGYAYRESFDSESEGRTIEYLSIKLDDPSFAYPVYARAYLSDHEELPLTWSRPKKKAA